MGQVDNYIRSATSAVRRARRFAVRTTGARLAVPLALVAAAGTTGQAYGLLLVLAAADAFQLSMRRKRWVVRGPLYATAGLVAATAAAAGAVRRPDAEATLLTWSASVKRTADGMRRA